MSERIHIAGVGLDVSVDCGRVDCSRVEIGLGHRGFEKEAESRGWSQAIPYALRLSFRSPGVPAVSGRSRMPAASVVGRRGGSPGQDDLSPDRPGGEGRTRPGKG